MKDSFHDAVIHGQNAGINPAQTGTRSAVHYQHEIPAGGGVVRNMMTTRDGNIVMAESALNIVALVTIAK